MDGATTWKELTTVEQTLMRGALSPRSLAGLIQVHGMTLRWLGGAGAPPPRSYTTVEQRDLAPRFAAAALKLASCGALSVHDASTGTTGAALTGDQLRKVLAEPSTWIWSPRPTVRYELDAAASVREMWWHSAFPPVDDTGHPSWADLTRPEREVLVCAFESSGYLTGPFGIWSDPPLGLSGAALDRWIEEQLAPLGGFVRAGLIEVRHFPVPDSDAYTVIGLEYLHTAFSDRTLRYTGDAWGVGLGCVFTFSGAAIWRSKWSRAWHERLTLD
jgi:hypothetical protein